LPLLQLLQAVGALPEAVRKKQELRGEELSRYKTLGRLLNDLEGVVVASRVAGGGQGYCLRYGIIAGGVEWLEKQTP
jgi:hypothetical protein